MNKNMLFIFSMIAILFLAACSPVQFSDYPGTQTDTSSNSSKDTPLADQTASPVQGNNFLSPEMKLLIGTIRLEGTKLEITPAQAKELFPLWVKMESTFADEISTSDDVKVITLQIQLTMTKDQLQAINDMNLTEQDLIALLQKLNISTDYLGEDEFQQTGTDVSQSTIPGINQDITPTAYVNASSPKGTPPHFPGPRGPRMIPTELLNALFKYLQARQSQTA